MNTEHVATTDGVPNWYLTPVRMFRSAFPDAITINSTDYNAVCTFLHEEDYGYRQIAQILDFSFDLGYVDILNNLSFVPEEKWDSEVTRIEELLRQHGLEAGEVKTNTGVHRQGGTERIINSLRGSELW